MALHDLEINLDLKQNLNVYANCKQLDTLHLIFNIFDDGVQADLSNYNVRLKAMKADNIPLIQDTEYSVVKNVVTIIAHEQLTTTSGVTKIELQFINKTTGEKKATFNLNLKVIASTLEVERSISIATYTLLEELENKLDRAVDIAENIDEAIEINKTLSTAITDATNTKNALEIETAKGNALKTDLTKNITDGNIINTTLENSITTGNQLKTDIDIKNIQAESNIKAMESFEDVTKLTQIVAGHTTQLSEKANDTDATRTTTNKTVTGAINELNTNKANKDGTNLYRGYLNANVDLNTVTTTGFYHMADATSITNKPSITGWSILEALNTGTYIRQTISATVGNNIYTRTRTESVWSAWKQLEIADRQNTTISNAQMLNGWKNDTDEDWARVTVFKYGKVVMIRLYGINGTNTTLPVFTLPSFCNSCWLDDTSNSGISFNDRNVYVNSTAFTRRFVTYIES